MRTASRAALRRSGGKGPVSRRCRSRAPGPPSRSVWTRGPGGATSRRARRLLPASCSRRVSPPSFRLFLFSSFPPSLPPPPSSSSFFFPFMYTFANVRGWPAPCLAFGWSSGCQVQLGPDDLCPRAVCMPCKQGADDEDATRHLQAPGAALSSTSHLLRRSPVRRV